MGTYDYIGKILKAPLWLMIIVLIGIFLFLGIPTISLALLISEHGQLLMIIAGAIVGFYIIRKMMRF